jgi:hypothetical protein
MVGAIAVVVAALAVAALVASVVLRRRVGDVDAETVRSNEGDALVVLGLAFIALGIGFSVRGDAFGYSWLPIGVVFLGLGARLRRGPANSGE